MNAPNANTPAPNATSAPAAPISVATPQVEPHTKASISPAEAAIAVGHIHERVASGKMTPEQADQAFDELGATPEQRAGNTRSEAAKEVDALYGPPAQPHEYTIPMMPPAKR
jgi:hypothetical protein